MSGKVGLLGLAFLATFIFGSFYVQLTSTPSRTQSARIDSVGEFTVHLQTQPDPPKTGGIPLTLHITDGNGKAIAVDKVVYEYEFQNRGARKQEGERVGDGVFKTVAGLDSVGDWHIVVTLYTGTQQTQAHFTLRVMPNI